MRPSSSCWPRRSASRMSSPTSPSKRAVISCCTTKASRPRRRFRCANSAALESDYDDLARDLGNPPRDNILVTLYTEQAFFDVTHAPSWSGAINDGKLRIPVSGLSSMTPGAGACAEARTRALIHHPAFRRTLPALAARRHRAVARTEEPQRRWPPTLVLFKAQQQHSA